ncbi:acyl--CoA ligase [Pseudonocardia sp. C8]|nr:class I adenylate-forming enzyme family protein [Pseudonocardia sp. C8]MBC3192769.1 acyl--CoA ligase [Pseudonocardia sp. C8]
MPRHLDYPRVTVGELHASTAATYGDRVALRDGEQTLTFAELHARACAVAHGLRAAGVRDRDVVVLHLPNSLWFMPCYYGILLAGAVVSPTNPLQPAPGLRAQIEETGAVAAISHADHVGVLQEARAGTRLDTVVVVPGTAAAPASAAGPDGGTVALADFVAGHPATAPRTGIGPDDVAHLAYTGGTTGVPKAVRVLHRNVIANVAQMTGWRAAHAITGGTDGGCTLTPFEDAPDTGVTPGDAVTIVVSPMFHAHALINSNFLLTCGTTLVLLGRFSAPRMLELIERERATYVTGSPTMWHALTGCPDAATRDLSSLRVVSSGAAPIDPSTMDALERIFPAATVVEGYGLTESTCLVSALPVSRGARRKAGSVGLPVFDTRVEIRALAPGDPPPGPGERGQLWVSGPQVTDGYLDRPEATAEQFVDGWLATGDIAYADEDGFLYICDRAKDMLIYKGYNVYPRALEDLLVTHPDVDAAAVVGRDVPSVGQEPVAFVVPAAGRRPDPGELLAHVAAQVLPYQKIRAVHLVDRLPSTAAGKILKTELREQANAQPTG